MSDRWRLVWDGPDLSLERNGSWYTGVEDETEAEAVLRNQRATQYEFVDQDGYTQTRRL